MWSLGSSVPATFGRMLSGAKGKGEVKLDVPSPLFPPILAFFSFFIFLFFFPFFLFFFFFSFFFFPGVSDADGWREEDKEASAAGADASLWLSGRSVPARMSVCCVSPTVPRQERSSNDRRGSAWTSRMW